MLNWTCPTGEQWERYVAGGEAENQPRLKEHLAACPYCRFIVGQLTGELDAVSRAWKSVAVSHAGPIVLFPLTPVDIDTAPALLAAQGNGTSETPDAIVLTTPDNAFLLKAVRDAHSGETWLFLIAENPGADRNVLVRPFGGTNEYITDDHGRVNLGKIDWPDPNRHTAEIRLPRATFVLTPPADTPVPEEVAQLTSPAGDNIRLTFTGEGRNRKLDIEIISLADQAPDSPIRIALRGPDSVDIIPLSEPSQPRASFDRVRLEGRLEIYLYQ